MNSKTQHFTLVLILPLLIFILFSTAVNSALSQAVPFAKDGYLKMFYDNRMHPQALEYNGKVFIVWRRDNGSPFITSYDLETRTFSEQVNIIKDLDDLKRPDRYPSDHHYSPVIWMDSKAYFHVLAGCHGNRPQRYMSGDHMVSKKPGDITQWEIIETPINISVNYPKPYSIYDNKILIYFRDGDHLGNWTYRVSSDGGRTWDAPDNAPVDLDAEPQDTFLAHRLGSYHSIKISMDMVTMA